MCYRFNLHIFLLTFVSFRLCDVTNPRSTTRTTHPIRNASNAFEYKVTQREKKSGCQKQNELFCKSIRTVLPIRMQVHCVQNVLSILILA